MKNNCLFVLYVTEEIPITVSCWAPDKETRPCPYHYCSKFLGQCFHLTSIELWSACFDLETCAHLAANPTTACQGYFGLLNVSNSSKYSFHDTQPSLGYSRVTILSAGSLRMLVHCKTQKSRPPDHYPRNSVSHLLGLQGLQQNPANFHTYKPIRR